METEKRDYKNDYDNDWKDIVEDKSGELNKDQVMRELSDYGILISSMSIILDHVTGGRISKPLTLPEIVCQVADENYNDGFADERKEYEETIESLDTSCGNFRAEVARLTAERDRMREEIEIAIRTLDDFECKSASQRVNVVSATKRHLQAALKSEAPNDNAKSKRTMTQEELDLLHANLE